MFSLVNSFLIGLIFCLLTTIIPGCALPDTAARSQHSKVSAVSAGLKTFKFGIDNFGKSAPYKEIYEYFGLTSKNIVKKVKEMINK